MKSFIGIICFPAIQDSEQFGIVFKKKMQGINLFS